MAHKGIWTCSLNVYKDLKRHNFLGALLKGEEPCNGFQLPDVVKDVIKDGYQLVLTGHSLGGSIATCVSMMLRSEFPSLKVYTYSPLPAFTAGVSESVSDYVFATCLGKDIGTTDGVGLCGNLSFSLPLTHEKLQYFT